MKKIAVVLFALAVIVSGAEAQVRGMKKTSKTIQQAKNIAKVSRNNRLATTWVDSVMKEMTLQQKVAQLMVIRVPLDLEGKPQREFEQVLRETEVGGVCFFVGTAKHTLPLIKRFQSLSKVPLLVCIDAEWGLGMRLSDCYSFPKNLEFGKLPKEMDTLLYNMGREIGFQCKNMGIHVNFAPVVDVNSNPDNPVIGNRSFSEHPQRVAELGIQYMKGLQSQGVMAVAKHFPGHGDTKTDSHFDLPVINHTREYMDTVDLYPFQKLIDAGVEGVMTAHLQVNAYESEANHPSSLSANLVSGLLRQQMRFTGMVITDGLDMKGVTKYYKDGEGELAAFLAGTDILLLPPDVPQAIKRICQAAEDNPQLMQLVEMRCRRVLRCKYMHGCANLQPETWRVPNADDSLRCDAIVRSLRLATEGRIDSIVNDGIAKKAYPGCQVLAMKDGKLLFRKAYGHQTYDEDSPEVTMNTIYDLASVTKMMSTTLAMMKLVETGKVKLDDPLSRYLPYLKNTDKANITIRQAMSHMARLKSFYPFWQEAKDAEEPRTSVLKQVTASHLLSNTEYVYSDLGFILLGDLIQTVSGQRLDIFVNHHFYSPMGLCNTGYNPLERGIDSTLIAPTENDQHYRMRLIRGMVHDENAFAMGGVSGHAGLFGTADDLARILQMLLNGGTFDGRRYLKAETVAMFNTRYFDKQNCRRGLGFDKPLITGHGGSACDEAPQSSYGHTGFTGIMVWVDPDNQMLYVFLSNRVYPDPNPNKLSNMNIRTKIQSELYRSIKGMNTAKGAGTATFGY
ncbi:MAG: serine hydrolase [Bacteroidales bacterium]|nr:serine hydrolase [Candidatus Colimorpha merdihippi]